MTNECRESSVAEADERQQKIHYWRLTLVSEASRVYDNACVFCQKKNKYINIYWTRCIT